MIDNVNKESNATKSNWCQFRLPLNNAAYCRNRATYQCAHCPVSYCLQHGLQHQEDLKDDVRTLLSTAQVKFHTKIIRNKFLIFL
jgi:hypothetical protein